MKTNKLILTTIILTFSLLSFSQESIMFDRMHNIDGYGSGAHGLKQTPDSGYIVCGAVGLTFYDDAYLLYKTDKYGEMQWYNYFDLRHSQLMDIDILTNGDYITAGYNLDNDDWYKTAVLIKYNQNGDTLWLKEFINPDYENLTEEDDYTTSFHAVLSTTDNNIIAGGYIGTNGYTNPYIVKTNLDGDTLWTWRSNYANNTFWINSIAETPEGDYVAVGTASSEFETQKEMAPLRGIIIKLSQEGNLIFIKEYEDVEYTEFRDLVIDHSNNIYIAGTYLPNPYGGAYKGFLLKTNSAGETIYYRTLDYGQEITHKSICLKGNKIFLTAMFNTPLGIENWYYDVLLQSYTTDGELLWQKAIGGQYNTNWPNDLILTNDGGIAFCGSNALDGYINSWIVKTDSLGNGNYNPGWENSVAQQQFALDVLLYPNPANEFVNIETSDNSTTFDLEIYTITGQKVFEKTNNIGLSQINVSGFSQGIYIVNIKSDNKVYTGKLSVKH